MRGPTSVLASSPGPRRSRSARSHTILSSLSCTRSCTTRRLVAVQRWPVVPNAPHSAPSRARSRSASSMTSIAFLPPISSERRLCIRPHVAPMTDPVSVDPVNETTGTSGCSTIALPTTEPSPWTSCTTSGGRPASSRISTSRCAVWGTSSAGLKITAFPLAIPTWKMFPALLCGNAVIFKPAEDVPHTAHLLVEILLEAGLPPEVVQLVHGEGSVVGKAMVEHPEVTVVSFTGSTEAGSVIGATCRRMHKRLALAIGVKAAMLVMDDADLELALDGVLWGAFGTTGQRCTATSRLVVHERVHDQLVKMLCDRAERLRLGPGLDAKTDVGPLINEDARKKVEYYVGVGREEGAQLLLGGERPTGKGLERGWFYKPTVLAGVRAGMRVEQEEIFGPVLSVIKVGSLDEAVGVNNDVKYGLSSSLYTRDVTAAFRAMGELDTGITYVNAPTIGAEAHLPFGGVKQTGNGHREGGWEVYDFYSETKVIYVDFSGKLQRAQIDTET